MLNLKMRKVITENKPMQDEMFVLKSKIVIKQHNLGITVKITDIPITTNENCISIIEEIGKKTNTELSALEVYRINSFL